MTENEENKRAMRPLNNNQTPARANEKRNNITDSDTEANPMANWFESFRFANAIMVSFHGLPEFQQDANGTSSSVNLKDVHIIHFIMFGFLS